MTSTEQLEKETNQYKREQEENARRIISQYNSVYTILLVVILIGALACHYAYQYNLNQQTADLGAQIAAEYDIPIDLAVELVEEAREYQTKVTLDDVTVFNASTGELFDATEYKYGNTSSIYYEETGEQYQYFHIYEKLVELVR